ncbi:MAG: NHL repeat-containing protein [Defluviitaleaceae bacterium]|nr:NHL repeat-containing protein [Defluviitaleaceae bacterium]
MRLINRYVAYMLAVVLVFAASATAGNAASPFQGFEYNFWAAVVPAPVAYLPTRTISAVDIDASLGPFSNPMDVAVCVDGNFFVADTGNNRIVVFDRDINLIMVIDGFYNGEVWDRFNAPHGVFVCINQMIYIADTNNRRIVILDIDANLLSSIENPDMDMLGDVVDFRPRRIVADNAGRVYAVVANVFEGIMRFDANGEFFGYFGTISVSISPAQMFWRMIATQAQRDRMERFIPTEFTGIDVDAYGFIFATHAGRTAESDQVMRLNPRGNNVLRNFNDNIAIAGVQSYNPFVVNSEFIDITARDSGKFSVLDGAVGRVFTYDSEGNLLYVFSGEGSIMGMNRNPVAIASFGDNIFILDSLRGRLIEFEPTAYGMLINEAIALRYAGDEAGSFEIWHQVLVINENSELAFTGIGRYHLQNGNYTIAMEYLRRGMDLRYFSMALARRRQVFVEENISFVFTGVMVLVGLFVTRSIYRKVKRSGVEEDGAV